MAQSLRQIKSRIRSIENTRKLTRAMEMISISKLRKSQEALSGANAYYTKIDSLLGHVLPEGKTLGNPFFKPHAGEGRLAVCVVTSDTGLCSAYNHSLMYTAENFLKKYDKKDVVLVTVGKKGLMHFTKLGYTVARSYVGLLGRYSGQIARQLQKDLVEWFTSGKVCEVDFISMHPKSNTHYKPVVQKFLPIEYEVRPSFEYILEPQIDEILRELIPEYLESKIRMLLMHAFTAEHQARAISMGEATHNATDLLEALVLTRNKMRQASITREIIEIISSAEALRG